MIDNRKYHKVVKLLRKFFEERNFTEIHTQSRLSILAACEDPNTISIFNYMEQEWPLPQTGQMWLEIELLKDPSLQGVFCLSTSFRNEPNPISGRHDLIFPMVEFEALGIYEDLIILEENLLTFLGFEMPYSYGKYNEVIEKYNKKEVDVEVEQKLNDDYGTIFFLTDFPESSSPFWNMKRKDNLAKKVDVIINGMETIGSAEREVDINIMRDKFHSISNGQYAETLYKKFGKERVEKELEEFLSLPMRPRYGGGIGITRLMKSF